MLCLVLKQLFWHFIFGAIALFVLYLFEDYNDILQQTSQFFFKIQQLLIFELLIITLFLIMMLSGFTIFILNVLF